MYKVGQKGFQKVTSLQAWGKLTEKYFGKKLRIEQRKDREHIYKLLEDYKLPHERFRVFKSADQIAKGDFLAAIGELGIPYWISATPILGVTDLDRLSKIAIETSEDGWEFIQKLHRREDYKIIIMQFAANPLFKGNALVSNSLNGIADFVRGDKHFLLTAGLSKSDPMLFDSKQIIRYSDIVSKEHQDLLYTYLNDRAGHYEFQYGTLDKKKGISFFDFNDEVAYEDIDSLFQDLIIYFEKGVKINGYVVKGIPANLGKAHGKCRVLLSSDLVSYKDVKEGEILVTDATNPEMTLVMKKVSAIVTDMGGVTSHAAIVCRELGIPAIVGATNATQLLKTGMNVEVDAFNGTVRIIGKNE